MFAFSYEFSPEIFFIEKHCLRFSEIGVVSLVQSSGGCLAAHCLVWERWGAEDWVVQVLNHGYRIPLLSSPPLSVTLVMMPSYSLGFLRGKVLTLELKFLLKKGAIDLAPLTLGFYSCMLVTVKASGAWPL